MADIIVGDKVKLHGGIEGTVIEKKDVEAQQFVVVKYSIGRDIQTTIRQTSTLVEQGPNIFKQTGSLF